MFGFTPHASRLGSISSHAAQVQAMGQQPGGLQPPTMAQMQPQGQPAAPAGSPASPPGQDPISQAYHWLAQQFGGASAAAPTAASGSSLGSSMTPDEVNVSAGQGGSSGMEDFLASLFG